MTGLVQVTIGREGGRVEETANGVTTLQGRTQSRSASLRAHTTPSTDAVLASRVELASGVTGGDVDLGLVEKTGHHVRFAVEEDLHARDRALGHDARAVAGLGAVGDDLALSVGDVIQRRRAPQAEV